MTTQNPSQTLLLFRVGPVPLCIDARHVLTLVSPPALTRPPGSGGSQPGLFRHTDGLVRVITLREHLGIPAAPRPGPQHDARIIITRLGTGLTGFQVERIIGIINAPASGWGILPPHLPSALFSRTLLHEGQIYLETDPTRLVGWRDTGALHAVMQVFAAEQPHADADTRADFKSDPRPNLGSIPNRAPAPRPAPAVQKTKPAPDTADKTHDRAPTPPAGLTVATAPLATTRIPLITTTRPAPAPIKAAPAASVHTHARDLKRVSKAGPHPRHPALAPAGAIPPTSHAAKTVYSATAVTPPHTHRITPPLCPDTAAHKGNPTARMSALAGVILFALLIGYGGQWLFSSPPAPPWQTHIQALPRHDLNAQASPVRLAQGQEEPATPTPPESGQPEPRRHITTHHAATSGMAPRQTTFPARPDAATSTASRTPPVRTTPLAAPGPHARLYRHRGELVIVLDDTVATKTSAPVPLPTNTIGATRIPATTGAPLAPAQSTSTGRNSPAEHRRGAPVQTPGPATPPVTTTEIVHIVVRGDTLWAIAERYIHNPFRYPELARLSHIRDPNLIYPGDRVRIIHRHHTRVTAGTVSGDNTGH